MLVPLLLVSLCIGGTYGEQALGPAFIWGSVPVEGQLAGQHTVYQPIRAGQVASILNNLTRQSSPTAGVDLVTVFSGPEVNLRKLALGQASGFEEQLKTETHGSSNSVTFPYVAAQEAAWELALKPARDSLWVGGSCGQLPSSPLSGLAAALTDSSPSMLLLCVRDCAESGCMSQALAAVQQHASSRSLSTAFAYIPSSPVQLERAAGAAQPEAAQRRRLQQQLTATTVLCNAKCQSQVKLFEAFILCATLLSALFTGMVCMHMLGTPERWEKPKDTQSRND